MVEEIQAVAEIISSLGEQGKSALIWWLVFDTVQKLSVPAAFITIAFVASYTVRRLVQMFAEASSLGKFIFSLAGDTRSFDPEAPSHWRAVRDHVRRWKEDA